jgi:uncharacterized membrane protein YfcA
MGLSAAAIAFLFAGAVFTAFMSAVAGIGGVLLFALMASVLEYAVLIPMYGAIQTTSAVSRVWLYRKDIIYPYFWSFLIPFIPAITVSILIWLYLIEVKEAQPYLKIAIAVYLFLFLASAKLRIRSNDPRKLMMIAGFLSGFFSMIVGVVGSIQAPFFTALKIRKEELVALFSVASLLANGIKIPMLFFVMDRLSAGHGILFALLAFSSVAGAFLGRKAIGKISETTFRRILHALLFVIACKLIYWDVILVIWRS